MAEDLARFSWISYWTFLYLIFAAGSMYYVKKRIIEQAPIHKLYKLVSLIFESALPSLLIFIIIQGTKEAVFLDSPAIFGYFPIILISALHLDFKWSLLSGSIAGLSYGLNVYYAANYLPVENLHFLSLPIMTYYSRAAMLMLVGVCAGFVGHILKGKIISSTQLLLDKTEVETLFSQQVSKPIMDTLIKENNGSKKQEATILFLDIEDFSHFAQSHEPEEVIAFQNKFFAPVIDMINKHNGVVHQMMGDGLMASFGTPYPDDNHADSGFNASRDIFAYLQNDRSFDNSELAIYIRIGLHSGTIISGNVGNEKRKQFSITGTPIIIAARLEQLNKKYNSRFLTTMDVLDKMNHNDFEYINHGEVQVKGIDEKVRVVEIPL